MRNLSARQLVAIGLFTALLAVLSQLSIPLPSGVPITLQTFAVALCGFVLGTKFGLWAVLVYLLLGAVGLPVFAGFAGGMGVVFGVTGGFLFGFLALCGLCGTKKAPLAALGLVLCHLCGVTQFSLVSATPFWRSVALVSLPYLVKDALSVAGAWLAAKAVRRGLAAAHVSLR